MAETLGNANLYFWRSFAFWVALHWFITPLLAISINTCCYLYGKIYRKGIARYGDRITDAYSLLSDSKKAYWRRLVRSYFYYAFATISGLTLLCSMRSIDELFWTYTEYMEFCFCVAASHFLYNCFEDWPCRFHMGRTNCERLFVFWGYIFHHVMTAGAFLAIVYTKQLGTMCCFGLAFEGPVFFCKYT